MPLPDTVDITCPKKPNRMIHSVVKKREKRIIHFVLEIGLTSSSSLSGEEYASIEFSDSIILVWVSELSVT